MGTIVVPCAGQFRYAEFVRSLLALDKPPGTTVVVETSGSVVQNFNRAIRQTTDGWVWLLGDDHVFAPDLLTRLLEVDADVAVPLCTKRTPPYHLVIGDETTVENRGRTYPAYIPHGLEDIPDDPFPVEVAGTAGMLIQRRVLNTLGDPWFENTDGLYLNEDVVFCQRARQAGFEVVCDPHAYLGHLGTVQIWPIP